jgi:hypothetical protein
LISCNTIVDLFCESAFFIAISHPWKDIRWEVHFMQSTPTMVCVSRMMYDDFGVFFN